VSDAAKARLEPLPRSRWDDDVRAALQRGFPAAAARFLSGGADAPPVPNVLSTLLHHPALAGPFLVYNRVLLETPTLEPRQRELMVLRVAWRTRSTYEWVQHARMAVSLGITPEEIDALTRGIDAAAWAPLEADLLAATDQLIDGHRIEDDTWARLKEQLDERQLVEVVFVVGTYSCLAMAFNSFGLELDPGLEPPAGVSLPE
jgi:4-carboxymuconolactone decarboxylase